MARADRDKVQVDRDAVRSHVEALVDSLDEIEIDDDDLIGVDERVLEGRSEPSGEDIIEDAVENAVRRLEAPGLRDLWALRAWTRELHEVAGQRVECMRMLAEELGRAGADKPLLDEIAPAVAEADADLERITDALRRDVRNGCHPWCLFEDAFGFRPTGLHGLTEGFLSEARTSTIDMYPLGTRHDDRDIAISWAVEYVKHVLKGNDGYRKLALSFTRYAAALCQQSDVDDSVAWECRFDAALEDERVEDRLRISASPKKAACQAVGQMVGLAWRTCEEVCRRRSYLHRT